MPQLKCTRCESGHPIVFPCSGRLGGVLDQPREVPRVHHGGAEVESIPVASAPQRTPCGASTPRSLEMYASRPWAAEAGGLSPQTSSIKRSSPHLAGAEKQRGEDGALLATAQLERQAVHVSLERAEDPEPKWR